MDVFIFSAIALSTLLLLTMLGLEYYEERVTRWMYLMVGVLACLLFYLAFMLTRSTYIVDNAIMN